MPGARRANTPPLAKERPHIFVFYNGQAWRRDSIFQVLLLRFGGFDLVLKIDSSLGIPFVAYAPGFVDRELIHKGGGLGGPHKGPLIQI